MSIATFSLVFYLLLVEVYSQTYPYVSFMSQTLANHSYVDITTVGGHSDNVQCITDLTTCCSGGQGIHRGDWYFPDGNILPFSGSDITKLRIDQRVDLRHFNNVNSPTGIYRCGIPTNAVHSPTDILVRDTFYIGLYTSTGGDVEISMNSDPSTGFTLTCVSTGGPATTVTWTRDSTTITEGTETVLTNATTATYIHTLTISTVGVYTCNVSNNKPSSAAASITIQGASPPSDVRAVQNSATSIAVTWTPPSPLGDITGYRISYTAAGGGGSDSKDVSGGSTSSDTLSGLTNGEIYTISVSSIATNGFPSSPLPAAMSVGLVPSAAVLNTSPSVGTTTITISGSVPSDSVITGYIVEWRRDTNIGCSDRDMATIIEIGSFTSYTITGLEPGNRYRVTVNFTNNAGRGPVSNEVTAMTTETAPSGTPTSFRVGTVTSDSITVQWGEVECVDRNGEITGYLVIVSNSGGGEEVGRDTVDSDTRQATFTGLNPSTQYTVSVAGINSAGAGPVDSFLVKTSGAPPPTNVTALQISATNVQLTWTPPSQPELITGYNISFTGGGTTESNIVDSSVNSYELTDLQNGLTYSISISSVFQSYPGDAVTVEVTLIPVPGQVSVEVRSITATSISLSWSVASGSVSSWEVVWRETDRGTESLSGSLPGTSYTIDQLDSTTIYTVRVIATNVAGTTTSSTLFISTAAEVLVEVCGSECDGETGRVEETNSNTPAIIGGVVAIVLILTLGVIVIVVLVLRSRSRGGNYSTSVTKRRDPVDVPASTNSQSLELTKFPEPTYADPDQFQTTSNEAYNIVRGTGGTGVDEDYEITIPPPLPPTSSSSQSATTGHEEYEPV